ncbi:LysR family transcriptional regulator [Streptomyces sp. AK02-01A]|uniref:LysR family transcriptional regulator n=1 Tax=Streptomyces sp. AK02-01A TaxID=3028648 RepID=UPI0029BAAAF2|nr:LysR substrate-binding domain-containing protein [Streptomyces sp. AK02-01A]MDX3853428.1 LysR substrate-binding domain-containing protein [Streptomyces sp. AK02-01A]
MDLVRHLECFVVVAEESHFGRAAARLGMAQPPLSQRIQRLERELGVRLFERSSRRVAITKAGTLLLDEARELLSRSEALMATARRIRDGESGLLRAALPPDIAGETVAAILAEFRDRLPGVELELRELSTAQQLVQFSVRELDVGLVQHPCDISGLELGPVLRREVGVLLPRGAPAAELDEVSLAALSGYDLILFPRTNAPALHDDILITCAGNGFTPATVRHGEGATFIRGLLLSVHAVAFGPRDTHLALAADQDPDLAWRPLTDAPLDWRHSVARPTGRGDTAVSVFTEAATHALRNAAPVTAAVPRPLHLRPTAEYWL